MDDHPENQPTVNPYEPMNWARPDAGDASRFFASLAARSSGHENDKLVPPGQRPCPICGLTMQPQSRQSISVDVCPDHGVWLDNGKVEAITEAVSVSRSLKTRRDVERLCTRAKLKGTLFGWLSFFLD